MRYVKLFVLVLVFFLVMLFFVQNQASFANPVTLSFDLFFIPPVESIPLPMYSIMLICFALGAFLVLFMLMWDRMAMSTKCMNARRKAAGFEKKMHKLETDMEKMTEKNKKAVEDLTNSNAKAYDDLANSTTKEIEKLKADLAEAESRLDTAMRTS